MADSRAKTAAYPNPLRRWELLPYMVHWAALTATGLFVAHVQITTRLLCAASPVVYWQMACLVERGGRPARAIVVWIVAYNIIGPFLHGASYPWT